MTIVFKGWRLFAAVAALLAAAHLGAGQRAENPAYSILIDSTGSMRPQFDTVRALGREIAHQVHDRGPVSIYCFESNSDRKNPRAQLAIKIEKTQDEQLLKQALDNIYIQGGQTVLLDAIDSMAEDRPKFMVLITDGEDRVSTIRAPQLIEKLKARNIKVYSIGLVHELEPAKSRKATDLLKQLSRETGGQAVIVRSGTVNLQNVIKELTLP
jgi:Mg-chelatase subunit ChlD